MAGRVRLVLYVLISMLVLLGTRALDLQVFARTSIISRVYNRIDHTVKLSARRGPILDRGGQPLAISVNVKSIAANPRMIKKTEIISKRLAKALSLRASRLERRLKSRKYFVWVKRYATPDEVARVAKLNIKGIGYFTETRRFYPEGTSLANILGIVGIDGDGLEGLELYYDNVLKGTPRYVVVERDGLGRTIYARGLPKTSAREGGTICLTIDRRLQYIAFKTLKDAVVKNNARSGFVIITNPMSGEIYAMASFPSFNPNKLSYTDLLSHKNRAVVDVFEPGSTLKPIWVSWGLDNHIFKTDEKVFCENGEFRVHRTTIHDHEKFGWLTVKDVVKFSSNIGMVKLVNRIEPPSMYKCLKSFGFGMQTGLDFPGEAKGILRPYTKWCSVDRAEMAFGQGISVTGIQLITAFNALVNGGFLIRPHMVKYIGDAHGNITHTSISTIERRVISPEASQEILEIMRQVTSEGGTGENAGIKNYQVFGKTGTAQKVDPITGAYSKSSYVATFVGGIMDALGRPALTMVVSINEPHKYHYASEVACPVFRDIGHRCVNTLGLYPVLRVAKKGDSR